MTLLLKKHSLSPLPFPVCLALFCCLARLTRVWTLKNHQLIPFILLCAHFNDTIICNICKKVWKSMKWQWQKSVQIKCIV